MTETQIQMNQSVQNVISCLTNYEMHLNNSDTHYSSIAYENQTSVSYSLKFEYEGFSAFKVVKKGYTNIIFTVLLLYQKISQLFSPQIISGDFDFNYESERIIRAIFSDYIQVVYETTHLGGALLDHVLIDHFLLIFYAIQHFKCWKKRQNIKQGNFFFFIANDKKLFIIRNFL